MIRNGSLAARILQFLRHRRRAVFAVDDLTPVCPPGSARSRALARLAREGLIEAMGHGRYRLLAEATPVLAFDRAWSNPGAALPPERRIAVTLARPTFRDVARLCRAYGVGKVRAVLDDLARVGDIAPALAEDWRHRLANIEDGFRDAAHRQLAG